MTFAPRTADTTIGVAAGAGTLQITSGILAEITAGGIIIGNSSDTGAMTADANTWNEPLSLISGTGPITIAGAQAMGSHNFTLESNATPTFSSSVTTTGNVLIEPATTSGNLTIGTSTGSEIKPGTITLGNTGDTGTLTADANTWSAPVTLLAASGNIDVAGTQTMGDNRFLADTTSGNITIGASGGVSSTASGNAITLTARDFINDAGASSLSAGNGRWLIYSNSPVSTTLGGLAGGFTRYGCVYGGECPSFPATGNGLLYRYNPTNTIVSQMSEATPPTILGGINQTIPGSPQSPGSGGSIDVESEILTPNELALQPNAPRRWWNRVIVKWGN